MLSGYSKLIAHLGYPTESFKAPLIYNPWFDSKGIDAVVVPMGVKADDYAAFFERARASCRTSAARSSRCRTRSRRSACSTRRRRR